MLARWTRVVLRYRWAVLAFWLVVLLVGGWSSTRLSGLLSNTFTVPGTDSERARTILQDHFGDRSDGEFLIVFHLPRGAAASPLAAAMERGAKVVPSGKAGPLRRAGDVVYGSITSGLKLADAKGYTDNVLGALRPPRGVTAYVSGQAAIQHDLDPIFSNDLQKGGGLALLVALLILVLVFGISWAVTLPFLFAAATITGTLGIVYVAAHFMVMATYATNLVELIGLGIACDYSLLVVYRFREELSRSEGAKLRRVDRSLQTDARAKPARPGGGTARGALAADVDEAVVRTMATAGRAVIFSGATVAIGLALLLFMPLPFLRSLGLAGFVIPIASIAAAATLQPALLSVYGRKGVRAYLLGVGGQRDTGFWHRLAGAIMRRPLVFLAGGVAILLAAATPVFALQLTPGSANGIPRFPQSVRGLDLLKQAVGPGALSPSQIVIDTGRPGGMRSPPVRAAVARFVARVLRDREVSYALAGTHGRYVDLTGRYGQVIVAGRHEYGEEPAQQYVSRLRGTIIPAARFPADVRVYAGGGPPQGVDFLHQAYRYFPWLVGAVLVLTYLLLMRAFRSLLLPLKAVLLNLLSVAAAYGMLVLVFRFGIGRSLFGLYQIDQVEGWIPIFLFAMLFGLSMDYEVFLVTRMREAWDELHDNRAAVAFGLERTGRIVTAAAVIMVAAFCGFVAGRIVGLQEFGLGLAVAIFVDATIVRAVLVPALMAVLGRWNWWLPAPVARLVRVSPSPLERPRPALSPTGR